MNRLFASMPFGAGSITAPGYPAMNVWTNEDGAVPTAELPGLNADDIDISVVGDTVTLSGDRQPDDLPDEATTHRRCITPPLNASTRTVSTGVVIQSDRCYNIPGNQLFSRLICKFSPKVQEMKNSRPTPRVGVALSGGGIRGLAHLGVLQVLEEADIPIDLIAGTSMGGIVAGLYAAGIPVPELIDFAERVGIVDIASPDLNWRGLFGHKKLAACLADLLGREDAIFEELRIPAAVVAADVEKREMVVLNSGPLIPALLATSAFPLLFAPVYHQGRWLVDGGAINNLPVDVVRRMGADRVLGVNVPPSVKLSAADENQDTGLSIRGLRFFSNRTRDWRMPFLIAEASVGLAIQLANRRRFELHPPDLLLEINLPNVGVLANDQTPDMIEAGRRAAIHRLPALTELTTRALPPRWWRQHLAPAQRRLRRAWMALVEPSYPSPPESTQKQE